MGGQKRASATRLEATRRPEWGSPPGPIPSTAEVSDRMARQRRRNTAPELAMRRELHRLGLRYRVDVRPEAALPRTADIVFRRARVAVFVDGCFWHGCTTHGTIPAANREWWAAKLARNVARDRDTDVRLRGMGWTVIRCWEHADMAGAAAHVESVVRRKLRTNVDA